MIGRYKLALVGLALLLLGLGCAKPRSIVGVWTSEGPIPVILELDADGKMKMVSIIPLDGTYSYTGNKLTLSSRTSMGQPLPNPRDSELAVVWKGPDEIVLRPERASVGEQPMTLRRLSAEEAQKMRPTVAAAEGDSRAGASPSSLASQCLANLKQLALGSLMYAQDFDEQLPISGYWQESLQPYVKSDSAFRCPAVPEEGYAYNAELRETNIRSVPHPETTPLVFDSDGIGKDAATSPAYPRPARHAGKNNVAYLDGHATAIDR